MDAVDFDTLPTPVAQPMGNLAPFLTFADVNFYIATGSHIGMWDSGCLLDDDTTHNCTQVCQDPRLLYRQPYKESNQDGDIEYTNTTEMIADFHVPYNIYNCMMYPYISSLLTSSQVSSSARSNARQLANEMHILSGDDIVDSIIANIRKAQWDCVQEFCEASMTCGQGLTQDDFENRTTALQRGPGLSQISSYNFPDWSRISERASMNVYTDIAGIGVSIAFYIQAGIILMCWLYTCFHRSRRYLSKPQHKKSRARADRIIRSSYVPKIIRQAIEILYERPVDDLDTPIKPRMEKRFSILSKASGRPSRVHVSETILGAICSFQSAQCFFLLSMNIAILIGLATPGPFMTSSSLGQFYNNLLYTQAVAQGAAAFVCATQYCLYMIGRGSPYFLFLTLLTFSTSAATFALAHANDTHLNASRLEIKTADPKHDRWQLYCGMVSPQTYNGSLGRNVIFGLNVNPYILGISILTFASAIIVGLAGGMYWRWHIQSKHENQKTACKRWYKRVFFVYSLVIEICAWGWIIVFIIFFWNPMYSVLPKSWSLGQVLAVSIWVPGLFEWVHAGVKLIEPKILSRYKWYAKSDWKENLKKSQARPTQGQQTLPLSSTPDFGSKRGSVVSISPPSRVDSSRDHARAPSEVPLLERNDMSTVNDDERSVTTAAESNHSEYVRSWRRLS